MNLSKRLFAVTGLITKGIDRTVADVGTDHGYIPIYMVLKDYIGKAIAMDINEGPLEKARSNVRQNKVQERVELRLSDGLQGLDINEADTIVIAGMGGLLINRIISSNLEIAKSADELILSPHSDFREVRKFLIDTGFCIMDEKIVKEDGKFYFILRAIKGKSPEYSEFELCYGKQLITKHDEVFYEYLNSELNKRQAIITQLSSNSNNNRRLLELEQELILIRKGISNYDCR